MIRIGVIGYGYWGPNLVRSFHEVGARSYEANLSVVKTARSMALQTLSIGKR